eukprot:2482087-Rhodomonas_salina.1
MPLPAAQPRSKAPYLPRSRSDGSMLGRGRDGIKRDPSPTRNLREESPRSANFCAKSHAGSPAPLQCTVCSRHVPGGI